MATQPKELHSRVAVLEHGFTRLETKVDSGMADLSHKLDKLISTGVHNRPNLYAAIGLVVAVVSIIGAIFSLAEWRVGVASEPMTRALDELRKQVRTANEKQVDLQVELAREKVLRELIMKNVRP